MHEDCSQIYTAQLNVRIVKSLFVNLSVLWTKNS